MMMDLYTNFGKDQYHNMMHCLNIYEMECGEGEYYINLTAKDIWGFELRNHLALWISEDFNQNVFHMICQRNMSFKNGEFIRKSEFTL